MRSRAAITGPVLYGGLAVILVALAAYYIWQWKSVQGFVTSIDTCDRLFSDFVRHYYPMAKTVLVTKHPLRAYLYSAFFALLLRPLAALPLNGALWAWGAFQGLCIVLVWLLPLRRLLKASKATAALYAVVVATSLPVFHNFAWGQVSMLMMVCVLGAFEAYAGGRRILAGCLLGFAAAIKQYPALFLLYFIVKRDARAIAAFAVSGIAFFAVIPSIALGPSEWVAFEQATRSSVAWADWARLNVNSQYFANVVLRYAHGLWPQFNDRAPAIGLQVLGFAVAALNIAGVWLAHRRKICDDIALSLTAILLALPFILGTSWPHYFCYLPFCQIVLLARLRNTLGDDRRGDARERRQGIRRKVLSGLVFASVAASSTILFNCFGDWSLYSKYGLLFFSNALLLVSLYTICLSPFGPGARDSERAA